MERKGDMNFFTAQNIKDCMKKVVTVNLHETVQVCCCFLVYLGDYFNYFPSNAHKARLKDVFSLEVEIRQITLNIFYLNNFF